jgi:hypothetical protein
MILVVFQIDVDKLAENALDLFKAADKYALHGLKVSIAIVKLFIASNLNLPIAKQIIYI